MSGAGKCGGRGGRDTIADRLCDEVSWLRQCADWLAHLDADSYPPTVNLRPAADRPARAIVAVDLAWVAAVIDRIAADVDELARARRVQDLDTEAVLPDPRAERRRRLAEPDLEFRAFCTRRRLPASSTPQLARAWDTWQAERYQRGEIDQRPGFTDNQPGSADPGLSLPVRSAPMRCTALRFAPESLAPGGLSPCRRLGGRGTSGLSR